MGPDNPAQTSFPEPPFTYVLPSTPCPEVGTILVTGASGYVGGRLVPALLQRGYKVRIMVRTPSPELQKRWPDVEIITADALQAGTLDAAVEGIHAAYYLIHSLALGPKRFDAADIQAAINFRNAAAANNVKRIIYLGGLGDLTPGVSEHLASRIKVALSLSGGEVPVTALRAAIIIGSGSASYEIIHALVTRLRLLPVPRMIDNLCQPIAIRDVIKYLVGCLETPETMGKSLDIGGEEIMTYREMMQEVADILDRRIRFLKFPLNYIRAYSYVTSIVTPVPSPIITALMEGLTSDVLCKDFSIRQMIPFQTVSYREALLRAMGREEQDLVSTRWSDAYSPAPVAPVKLQDMRRQPQYTVEYSLNTKKSASALFDSVCRIGGKEGWGNANWMWRLRGFLDRVLGGIGYQRGRRSSASLEINDVIDFWRVEDLTHNQRLLLRAEMKLPGRAWLEFSIEDRETDRKLNVKAHFCTKSLLGELYWYTLVPFHGIAFKDLIRRIDETAT